MAKTKKETSGYKVKDDVELYPFGAHCEPIKGEVSVDTYTYLIESGKATDEDFEEIKT